ncbi:MAG: ABC transporter ATP-binding protein [Candidatus Izemoplasmatales bacterium]|nr:ABC transporter ATP-binding protein [Candidatus Izemoplasmatales bacterium]MDD4596014.1 ABC transporter ATP-binding protein [Candidatus Izemoplasmatales bacterium]
MMSSRPHIAIEMEKVSKKYGTKTAIQNINIIFESETLNLLVGTNGSGKSTLLKCIMGLVHYDGTIKKRHFRIGYAPEEYVMPYFMSIRSFLENVGSFHEDSKEHLTKEINLHLDYFDLRQSEHKPIGKISNGMRQKVNLIQAFLHHPKILLLDEPLSALDIDTQGKAMGLIRERMTESLIIVSTHSPEKYKFRRKRICVMVNGTIDNNNV